MGEGDPRAVSARLPGSVLQATEIRLAIATYLCCVTQVRALRRAAAKAPLRHRRVGETSECRASKASRASVRCEARERYTKPLLILYRPF